MSYRDLIQTKTEEIQEKLLALGFAKIHTPFSICKLPKGVAGRAWGYDRFEISIDYLEKHTDRILSRTVPHEIAHMYTAKYYPQANGKGGHGREWKKFMEALGCEQNRYHDMKLTVGAINEPTKIIKQDKEFVGIYDVLWNKDSQCYNGFINKSIVATDISYNKVKKIMQESFGCKMFNVVIPSF